MNVGGVERRKIVGGNRHHLQKIRWSVNRHIGVAMHNVTEIEVCNLQRCLCLQERVTFPVNPSYTSLSGQQAGGTGMTREKACRLLDCIRRSIRICTEG